MQSEEEEMDYQTVEVALISASLGELFLVMLLTLCIIWKWCFYISKLKEHIKKEEAFSDSKKLQKASGNNIKTKKTEKTLLTTVDEKDETGYN